VPASNTEMTDVFFAIFGKNENLDAEGNVVSVWDAEFINNVYRLLCDAQGFPTPNIIGVEIV
jgi:hypothetical protein